MFSPDEPYFEDHEIETSLAASYMKPPGIIGHHQLGHHSTPTRVSIREANEHLQLLHQRVSDLEDIIRNQGMALNDKEANYRHQLIELKESKERHIEELTKIVLKLEEKNRVLERELLAKGKDLEASKSWSRHLEKFLALSLPSLEKFVGDIKELTNSSTNPMHNGSNLNNGTSQNNGAFKQEEQNSLDCSASFQEAPMASLISITSASLSAKVTNKPVPSSSVQAAPQQQQQQLNHFINKTSNHKVEHLVENNIIREEIEAAMKTEPSPLPRRIRQLPDISNQSDSGHPSSNNSDSGRVTTTNYSQVLDELKGHYQEALRRELEATEREIEAAIEEPELVEPMSEPLPVTSKTKVRSSKSQRSTSGNSSSNNSTSRSLRKHSLSSSLNGSGGLGHNAHGPISLSTNSPTGSGSSTPNSSVTHRRRGSLDQASHQQSQQPQTHKLIAEIQARTAVLTKQRSKIAGSERTHIRTSGGSSKSGHRKAASGYQGITLNYSEDDDQEDYDCPPPPAPPPTSNTTNDNLPSIKAPTRRYFQSSY